MKGEEVDLYSAYRQ